MSTAEKLKKVLDTKLAIKQAIIEKGVAISDTDTFASYPNKIKIIPTGGGSSESGVADKLFVENKSGVDFVQGEKVLVNFGEVESSSAVVVNEQNSNKQFMSAFLNDNTFLFKYYGKGYNYTYKNNEWVASTFNASSINPQNTIINPDGMVVNTYWKGGYGGATIYTPGLERQMSSSGHTPIGEYNGVNYAVSSGSSSIYYNNIYSYNPSTLTSTTVLEGAFWSSITKCFLEGNNIFAAYERGYKTIKINEDNTLTVLPEKSFGATVYPQFITGIGEGEILFTSQSDNPFNGNFADTNSVLSTFVMSMSEDGVVLTPKTIPQLAQFETTNCFFFFDPRNDVLTVGTRDNVYAFQFDKETKSFNEIGLSLELPEKQENQYYHLFLSPDLSKAIVSVFNSSNYIITIKAYIMETVALNVYSDSASFYRGKTSFTGFATGNVDENGRVEVEMLLPEKIDLNIVTDIDVLDNEVIFEGVI